MRDARIATRWPGHARIACRSCSRDVECAGPPEARRVGSVAAVSRHLHADVVKVGHHGSQYASTPAFVATVHPRIAVISVDRHNTFGHPARATIEAWQQVGADVLRTDECGAISFADWA
jgi:beta-lactamase superfamily II metal-dependent hydrolase